MDLVKLFFEGELNDDFGWSVAVSGDTAIVGAPFDGTNGIHAGAAYIYKFDGAEWNQIKLTADDGAAFDEFGYSVAISGNTAIVGAPLKKNNKIDSGAAYIYKFDGTEWNLTNLLAPDGADGDHLGWGDHFGWSVAISGNTAVVGAPFYSTKKGAAYIYKFDGTKWNETKLLAHAGAVGNQFGLSVAISGNTAVVGAPFYAANRGAAYIYKFDGAEWNETKLLADDGLNSDQFGWSVAVSGDTAVVGVPFKKRGETGFGFGAAYIYKFDGTKWNQTKLTTADDGAAFDKFGYFDEFGWSVAVSGNTIVVGATLEDSKGVNSGAAYIYKFDGTKWTETKLLANDGASGDWFGYSVAVSGDTAVVSAPFNEDKGAAYVLNWNNRKGNK